MGAFRHIAATIGAMALLSHSLSAEPIRAGVAEERVRFGNVALEVTTYRPDCQDPSLLLAFHGLNRNMDATVKSARQLADRFCMIVVAPHFDRETFRSWAYQRGGIVRRNRVLPASEWTVQYVPRLVRWAERREGRELNLEMIGHSAGAQFLSRVAAFTETGAQRIVIANPSSHVFASLDIDAPFGLGGVYRGAEAEARLRDYLARPITILLGARDTGDRDLGDSEDARAQGENRLERGRNAFAAARGVAQGRGYPFNWQLVIVQGVGHSSRGMYGSPEAASVFEPAATPAPSGNAGSRRSRSRHAPE